MKALLPLWLVLAAGLCQIAGPATSAPLGQTMRLCEETNGMWNTTTLLCDCPSNFAFDKDRGCHNLKAESLCTKTQGVWFINNRKSPPAESCDCGLARKWSDTDGCYGGILESILDFIRSLIPSYLRG